MPKEIPYRTHIGYLIVNSNGDMKVRKTRTCYLDEVSFKVSIKVPALWGREVGTIELEIPEGVVELTAEFEAPKPDDAPPVEVEGKS
jgi:hypothetical protein